MRPNRSGSGGVVSVCGRGRRMRRPRLETLEPRTLLSIFTVTTTADAGAGSLRAAVVGANAAGGASTIQFNIPGAGVHTISPASPLPAITATVTIDGGTQPGYSGAPLIELRGDAAGTNSIQGIDFTAPNSIARDLAVNRFSGNGVFFDIGADNGLVAGCFLGTDPSGTIALGNQSNGIRIRSYHVTVGGSAAADRNILSGNSGYGVAVDPFIIGPPITGNVVIGNYIGTDVTGTVGLGNKNGGVEFTNGSAHGTVGGSGPGEGNLIAGNGNNGVELDSDNSLVAGNLIGTDITGTIAIPNTSDGVKIGSVIGDTIGGTSAGARNIISGNKSHGIFIFTIGSSDHLIQGNYIGVDVSGAKPLGNGSAGISNFSAKRVTVGGTALGARNIISGNLGRGIDTFAGGDDGFLIQGNYIGTDVTGTIPIGNQEEGILLDTANATVGGTDPGAGNIIANSLDANFQVAGVRVANFTNNTIVGNSIYNNAGLGIDLNGGGKVIANHIGAAQGPNNLQNYPVLTSVVPGASSSMVSGSLNSLPNSTYAIDFYANTVNNPSGYGEGQTYLGRFSVTTDASGNTSFTTTVPYVLAVGQSLCATATDTAGNTSEFSADYTLFGQATDLSLSMTGSPNSAIGGGLVAYTLTVKNNGPNVAYGVTVIDQHPSIFACTFVSVTASQGTGVYRVWDPVVASLGTLPAGQSATVVVTVRANTNFSGAMTNSATVSAVMNAADPNSKNNSASVDTQVVTSSDLSVTISGPATDPVGQPATYLVTVHNNGPSDAANTKLVDTLPGSAALSSVILSQGTYGVSGSTLTASVGNLIDGQSATLQITLVPSVGAVGAAITDTVVASSDTTDANSANNSASISTTIDPSADVSVAVAASPNPAQPGQTLTYTVTVTNSGPNSAGGVTLSDTLPSNVTFVSAVAQQGSASQLNGVVTAALGSLAAGASTTVVISATPQASAVPSVTNSATVSSVAFDPTSANNSATTTTKVSLPTALAISVIAAPSPAVAGAPLSYTLSVTNSGPNDAANVVVQDAVPANTTFVSVSASQGTASQAGGLAQASLGTIAANTTATVTLLVLPTGAAAVAGAITDVASITTDAINTTPGGASSSLTTPVHPSSDLFVAISDSPDPVAAGQLLAYTITVTNLGPNTATNVALADTLAASVTFVSANAQQGSATVNGGIVNGSLGTLVVGASTVVTINVRPKAGAVGSIMNQAAVSADQADLVASNNTATQSTTVNPGIALSITMSGAPNPVLAGALLTYTLTVSNAGPNQADNVVIVDTLPTNAAFISEQASQGLASQSNGQATANLGSLAVGGSATFTIVVRPTGAAAIAGSVTNSATVGASELNNTPGSSSTSQTTVVALASDLAITINGPFLGVYVGQPFTYTLTIANNGPNAATGVTVMDTLPANVSFVSAVPLQGAASQSNGVVTALLGSLAVGVSTTVAITVQPDALATGTIHNAASVSEDAADPNTGNNSVALDTTVGPVADLLISLGANPSPVIVAGLLTYTLTVSNPGPNVAHNVLVTDTLPGNVTFFLGLRQPGDRQPVEWASARSPGNPRGRRLGHGDHRRNAHRGGRRGRLDHRFRGRDGR
jgi:uncharacterized repeat protein (TIGR01451 family)